MDRIQSLRFKSDFFTAWDFAGQNYLYYLHTLFLSPRSIYLLLVDLTIEDLQRDIEPRHRDDRHIAHAKLGVPTTYMGVYEFWLNAIYSVTKKGSINELYIAAKVIFVFSKADKVENPEVIARNHLQSIKEHMCNKNNSYSLVHEDDDLFLLSCKMDSLYFKNLLKLKATIKRLSDQVAFEEPIPIKWLKLANSILRAEESILDKPHIEELAKMSMCLKDLPIFLHFFNEIGLLFYKEGKIIIGIQQFLDLIYHIMFPKVVKDMTEQTCRDIDTCINKGILSHKLFIILLESVGLFKLKIPVLELLSFYGILLQNENKEEGYYVPYLLTSSSHELSQDFSERNLVSRFFVYFPDLFLPASVFFSIIAKCLQRHVQLKISKITKYTIGFDCAIFHVSRSLLVYFNFIPDHTKILIFFYCIDPSDSDPSTHSELNSDIIHYLIFLQLSIIKIQSILIPWCNLAKIIFVCDSCNTLSLFDKKDKPTCSLDTVLAVTNLTFGKRFCCGNQLIQVTEYAKTIYSISYHKYQTYDNSLLAHFILDKDNREIFFKHLNWRQLSDVLFLYGLITDRSYCIINDDYNISLETSEILLMEMVNNSPYWASKFCHALDTERRDIGHRKLLDLIEIYFEEKKTIDHKTESFLQGFSRVYKMDKQRHGIALIVNIESFEDGEKHPLREGSRYDVASLVCLFNFIQYDTRVYKNLTRKEYIRAQRVIQSLDHSQYDSFFCVIMSHGNEKGEVIFSNNKPLSKCKIVNEFSPRYCKGLESKPKIFIFQACRGTQGNIEGLNSDDEQFQQNLLPICSESYNSQSIPIYNKPNQQVAQDLGIDIFIGDSTLDKYVSYRTKHEGTYFIQSFCSVMQSCINMEFTHIMIEVRKKVFQLSNIYRQCTEDTNRLQKQVYF